jgi:putative transposase
LNPNPEQEKYFIQACDAARIAYNSGLAEWERMYQAGEKPNVFKVKKRFNAIKRLRFPWMLEVTKSAPEGAIRDLGKAFSNFFKNPTHFGHPTFKNKGRCKLSFYLSNDQFKVVEHYIRIPKLDKYTGLDTKWVNMAEKLRFKGRILSARISQSAGKWYVSIQMACTETIPQATRGEVCGIDLGINRLATTSRGEITENIQAMRRAKDKLKSLQRQLSRRQKGSEKWKKTKLKIKNVHQKIVNQRRDHIHKMTTYLTSTYGFIAIEALNFNFMLKNHKLALSISDPAFSEIVRQIEYKSKLSGTTVQKVGRFFPSSKTCSNCGNKDDTLTLTTIIYKCDICGLTIDRDLNAALNILKEGLKLSILN